MDIAVSEMRPVALVCVLFTLIMYIYYLAPGGGCEVLFSPGLSVCVSVYVCISVCPANILIFYISATRRDIDLTFIQDTYRVVLDSLKKLTFIGQRSRSQGRYIAFVKVQSCHKN